MNATDEENYLKHLRRYHNDRIEVLSEMEKEVTCKGCPNEKLFLEGPQTLTYSCGSLKKTECGEQYVVRLPEYIDYHNAVRVLTDNIHGNLPVSDNPNDISQQNLQELHKLTNLPIEDDLNEQTDDTKASENNLKEIHKMYILY